MDDLYQQNILDHYHHPKNGKLLETYDLKVDGSNPSCGDDLVLTLKFDHEKIADIGYDAAGCAISTAAMSLLSEKVKGMTRDDAVKITDAEVYALLGVPIGHEREKCALLGVRTLRSALK